MKTTFKNLFLLVLVTMLFVSCNTEELFVEPITQAGEEDTDINAEDTEDIVEDTEEVIIGPCDFSLDNVESNSTIIINCIMDLQGQTINLPANVSIEYDGGDIINGTLNFSDNSIISGELLNSTLTLGGSNPQLKDPVFQFTPSRWGIVEGKVSDEVAQKNKEIFQSIITLPIEYGMTTFKTDQLDVYFLIGAGHKNPVTLGYDGIHLPSDFNFVMTENTFLRVQPTHYANYRLLSVVKENNVNITGGNLIGDRYTHDYSSGGEHGQGALFQAVGATNVVVDGVYIAECSGDGFRTFATALRNADGSLPAGVYGCDNITIKNSTIHANRRNNFSIVDGQNIYIENNTISNAGDGNTGNPHDGVLPKCGIDIEPHRVRDVLDATMIEYEKANFVYIRNNVFVENVTASVIVYSADDIFIESNTSDTSISLRETANTTVSNNIITENQSENYSTGITMGDFRMYTNGTDGPLQQFALNNKVIGNTITGFGTGIKVRGSEGLVKGNKVYDCGTGLIIEKAENTEVSNNEYVNNQPGSGGIILGYYGNNVDIHDEYFEVGGRYLYATEFNLDPKYAENVNSFEVTIRNSVFKAIKPSYIKNTYGVNIVDNDMDTGIEFYDSFNASFKGNDVTVLNRQGVLFGNINEFEVSGNSFNLDGTYASVEGGSSENISIIENTFHQTRGNSVVNLNDTNNSIIEGNSSTIDADVDYFVYFLGNNSSIINNMISPSSEERNYIEGSNNTIN